MRVVSKFLKLVLSIKSKCKLKVYHNFISYILLSYSGKISTKYSAEKNCSYQVSESLCLSNTMCFNTLWNVKPVLPHTEICSYFLPKNISLGNSPKISSIIFIFKKFVCMKIGFVCLVILFLSLGFIILLSSIKV